jgi:hypothetical protein
MGEREEGEQDEISDLFVEGGESIYKRSTRLLTSNLEKEITEILPLHLDPIYIWKNKRSDF